MATLKDLVLQVRYPYTAGVIATIWLGTALLVAVNHNLPVNRMLVLNVVASIIIALVGFTNRRA